MIAAKRAGRSGMVVSLGGNAASLPHRSLRRPALPHHPPEMAKLELRAAPGSVPGVTVPDRQRNRSVAEVRALSLQNGMWIPAPNCDGGHSPPAGFRIQRSY